ncbi:hypothetical protein MLD38_029106 [Melastoma candidum]|uniref:Uncharacterized protein n=1 Tax=Melastoma candidum TaxID=119954 RepID=A0ACB9N3K7_9MYRT|nr:hypothetical protein MLD38_029106 [Melastoma candidum]
MIRAYSSSSSSSHRYACLRMYKEMLHRRIVPDCLTFPFLLKESVNGPGNAEAGRSIHGHVIKFGFCGDTFISNSLISLYSVYADSGDVARELFEEMPVKDLVSWNSVIIGYLRRDDLDEAREMFERMIERNVITWNSMITGFAQGGRPKEALEIFLEMEKTRDPAAKPDKITIASALSACASLGALDFGKRLHDYLRKNGIELDIVIKTALIDMYGKCGSIEEASKTFRAMPSKDNMAWTAMISAFALHGCCEVAFQLLEEMENQGLRPNHVTFVALLSACAHSGSVEKGRQCFKVMKSVYGMEQQVHHYACMVDILSRAGLFGEAEALIREMPMEPDSYVWGALLAGCQMHGNVHLGESVAKRLISMDPENHAFYVSMQGMYAKAGRFEDRNAIRALMDGRGIRKEVPGNSFIEIGGIVHEFSIRGSPGVNLEGLLHVLNCLCEVG